MTSHEADVLVVGAGPCGLGAATRLEKLRREKARSTSYLIVEARSDPGGWASSVTTPEGFTFDYGGHVLFPHRHYAEFAQMIDDHVDAWHFSVPKRGVWVDGELVPYPIQRNIQRLRTRKALSCLAGLVRARVASTFNGPPQANSLDRHLRDHFGSEMTSLVLGPLNEKMWACSTDQLSSSWARYRSGSKIENVAGVSLWRLLVNLVLRIDDPGWSPATRVPYPLCGGTGTVWSTIADRIPGKKMLMATSLTRIDSHDRVAHLADGTTVRYRAMVSSMPLDVLLRSISDRPDLNVLADGLVYSHAHLLGLGLEGPLPERLAGVHSFHVPQPDVPMWRVSFPAAFSPRNVPGGHGCWSVLCESAEPMAGEAAQRDQAVRMEEGLRALDVLRPGTRVVSRWSAFLEHGYPTPFLSRDLLLPVIQSHLRSVDIFSRGRFGGWRYEISNQDHSFMQGIEVVNHRLFGEPEATYT
jgi:protoporphyrinogen oxidase